MDLVLLRYNYAHDVTQGVILLGGEFFTDTLECPWKGNKPFLSCIPAGVYGIEYREDAESRVHKAFVVKNVPHREGILIHVGNTIRDFEGCIGLGARYGNQLYNSARAFSNFRALVGDVNTLKITGVKDVL